MKNAPLGTLLLLGLGCWSLSALAENVDPAADGSRYVYAENLGWVNAEPLGDGGPGMHVTDFALTGWMWSENTGWISLSCENTASCATADHRVTNDGSGNLAGYAWSENLGWINFGPATAGVRVDPASGQFSGHAWSENGGWLSFNAAAGQSWGLSTSWTCDPPPAPPVPTPVVSMSRSGSAIELSWDPVIGASAYDVVSGRLKRLRNSGGDFTSALDECVADNYTATSLTFSSSSHQSEWFLVRAINCGGLGTYDGTIPTHVAPRDAEIDADPDACP